MDWIRLVKPLYSLIVKNDTKKLEVAADINNVSSFSPVSSVINNAPKNFATSAATYIEENR